MAREMKFWFNILIEKVKQATVWIRHYKTKANLILYNKMFLKNWPYLAHGKGMTTKRNCEKNVAIHNAKENSFLSEIGVGCNSNMLRLLTSVVLVLFGSSTVEVFPVDMIVVPLTMDATTEMTMIKPI